MLTAEQIEDLQALAQPNIAEILALYWDGEDETPVYYASTDWNDFGNYIDCPFSPIEARLITGKTADGTTLAHPLPLFPDINSAPVTFTFADTDQDIKAKFKANGSVKAELIYYFPQIDAYEVRWFGHINIPKVYGLSKQVSEGHTGFRSPEFLLPSEIRMKECRAKVFGGKLETVEDIARSLCPYDKHLGGTEGINNPDTSAPFTFCPQISADDCTARFGHSRYFGGYHFEAPGVTISSNFLTSRGHSNDSLLRYPISVVFGAKIIMELPVLQYYTRQDTSNPDRGTVHIIAEVSNDQTAQIFNVLFSGKPENVQSFQVKTGRRGQSPTGWVFGVSNYSGLSHIYLVGKYSSNPGSVNVSSIKVGCYVHGFNKVRVYSDAESYTQSQNNHRVWSLLELYTNNRWGLGYRHSRFDIDSFIDVHDWCVTPVRFTLLKYDGTEKTWDLAQGRTIFDANVQGRPASEQITDICRTGRFWIHQYDGKYTLTALKKATEDELTDAPVFSDAAGSNILWAQDGETVYSTLRFSEVDAKTLKNELISTIEDADNNDISRPLRCFDSDQQALAGKLLGTGGFKTEKTNYVAYGVRRLEEGMKFGYSVLWFGEFDKGGIKNNLKGEFVTTLRQALGLRKFQIIKITSTQNDYLSPEGNPFQYFRVIDGQINSDFSVSLIVQAYNEEAYETFEINLADAVGDPTELSTIDDFTPKPLVEDLSVSATYANGYIEVEVT